MAGTHETVFKTAVEGKEYVQTRMFGAPRELVFACWTDPARMAKWWGPHQFTNPVCELDARPGGKWRIVMRGPDGSEHPAFGTFLEVIPPEKLVMSMDHSELSEEWHDRVNPGRDRSKGKPKIAVTMTVLFEEVGGKTKLTIRQSFESAAVLASLLKIGMTQGWAQSLERLDAELGHAAR